VPRLLKKATFGGPRVRTPRGAMFLESEWQLHRRALKRHKRRHPLSSTQGDIAFRLLVKTGADNAACDFIAFVPASGESFTRCHHKVGGSIGCACKGSVTSGAQSVSDAELFEASDRDDIASLGLLDRRALNSANARILEPFPVRPHCLAVQNLDALIGPSPSRENPSRDEAAKNRDWLRAMCRACENRPPPWTAAEHASGRDPNRGAMPSCGPSGHRPSQPVSPNRRESGNRVARRGVERGEQIEHFV